MNELEKQIKKDIDREVKIMEYLFTTLAITVVAIVFYFILGN